MPPTDTERRLYEATARGDWDGQVAAIAGEDLYLAVPQQGQDPLPVYDDPTTGGKCIPVLTRGMLPPWQPQQFFDRVSLEELAQDWPNDKWRLAVNPGYAVRRVSGRLARPPRRLDAYPRPSSACGPADCSSPTSAARCTVPIAQGLACGAPIAVHHSVPWNELGTAFLDHATDAETLREQWSVTDPAGWQQRLDQLLGGGSSSRRRPRRRCVPGPRPETGETPRRRARRARGNRNGGDRGRPEVPELVARYEERFRADGLLPADGQVVSLVALDHAHAVNLVRWGLGARLCAPQQAEQAVQRAGAQAREVYGSWEEFAAGYALGRMLAFDNGWFGPQYAEAVHIHRVLTQDPVLAVARSALRLTPVSPAASSGPSPHEGRGLLLAPVGPCCANLCAFGEKTWQPAHPSTCPLRIMARTSAASPARGGTDGADGIQEDGSVREPVWIGGPARRGPDLEELLGQVARGDQGAFGPVYDALAGPVLGLVRSVLRDPAQSEEVAQEVLVEVWRTAARFRPERGSATNWVLTLAHRRAVDRVRSAQAAADREHRAALLDHDPGVRRGDRAGGEPAGARAGAPLSAYAHRTPAPVRHARVLQGPDLPRGGGAADRAARHGQDAAEGRPDPAP